MYETTAYRIITMDGGSDHLLPARWLAFYWWGGRESNSHYGTTEEEAIGKVRTEIERENPNAVWLSNVPIQRMR